MTNENTNCDNKENLRAEYTAISTYFSYVVTFRFTVFGFYVLALSFIQKDKFAKETFLILVLGWIFLQLERRTVELYRTLLERGKTIENDCWKYEAFFSLQEKSLPKKWFEPTHTALIRFGYYVGMLFTAWAWHWRLFVVILILIGIFLSINKVRVAIIWVFSEVKTAIIWTSSNMGRD